MKKFWKIFKNIYNYTNYLISMANKKIIFLIITAIVVLALGIGLFMLNAKEEKKPVAGQLKIWINEWTTEDFQKLIDGFNNAAPENKKISVVVEKKSSTTTSGYNTLLLTAIADKSGPDIFMLPKWEDANLAAQIGEIPDGIVNITDFQRRFDGIFGDLISTKKNDDKTTTKSLLGVPLGYEMLGVFYNKSLLRTGVPKEWSQVEMLYNQFPAGKFPTNLGLGKTFVPNVADIISLFLINEDIFDYSKLPNTTKPFQEYYSYGDLNIGGNSTDENVYTQNDTLRRTEAKMSEQKPKLSTIDEFVRGNIGMIIGFPSFIKELEDADKRAWKESAAGIIFTDVIPQVSVNKAKNLARYNYFAASKNSENGEAIAKFMNYLMSEDAGRIALEIYPNLIPAQTTFLHSAENHILSEKFPKATLDAFMPQNGVNSFVFEYGFKETFRDIIEKNWNEFSSAKELSGLGEEINKAITSQFPNAPKQ